MKVSLVIPAYNEEEYLTNCLTSVVNQEVKPDEIIVVDNASTDKTPEIARSFKVRVVSEKRRGMILARNKGFNSAKYEILARTDADTVLPTDWIKRIKENFRQHEVDAFSGPAFFYDSKLLKMASEVPVRMSLVALKMMSKGKRHLLGPNMALTRRVWMKVKDKVCLDESRVQEDSDLSIHITSVGGKIGYDQRLVVGISARRMKNNPKSFFLEYPLRAIKTIWLNRKKLRK